MVQNDKYRIDDNIKFSLTLDIASGMAYLHSQGLLHGQLTSNSCFIDQRWNVRVADWEHHRLTEESFKGGRSSRVTPLQVKSPSEDPNIRARQEFFSDPELLRQDTALAKPHDVYSFAMILVEIFTREDPFTELSGMMEPYQIVDILKNSDPLLRPKTTNINPPKVSVSQDGIRL